MGRARWQTAWHSAGRENLRLCGAMASTDWGRLIEWALQRRWNWGAKAVVQMDADFSHAPDYVPLLLEHLKEYDVAVGSRYVEGGALDERWGVGRYLLSWWANSVYTRLILDLNVKDATAGFKAWRRKTLQGLNLKSIQSNGYDFQIEMAFVTEKLGYSVIEHPIYFEDRRIGRSKMTVPIKLEAALRTWEILWRHRHLTPDHRKVISEVPSTPTS